MLKYIVEFLESSKILTDKISVLLSPAFTETFIALSVSPVDAETCTDLSHWVLYSR